MTSCEKLFDGKTTLAWVHAKNSVRFEMDSYYLIERVLLFQFLSSTNSRYRAKSMSLSFSDGTSMNFQMDNTAGWNEIILPQNVISNYLNFTIHSSHVKYSVLYLPPEIQIFGCRPGNCFLVVSYINVLLISYLT